MRLQFSALFATAFALTLTACPSDDGGSDSDTVADTETTEDTTTDDDVGDETTTTETTSSCEPGTFNCECDNGMCADGLECVDNVCEFPEPMETTTDGGGNEGMCGWSAQAGFYDCNQAGEDPGGTNPIECPEGEYITGGPCPEGLTFEGCCFDDDLWWCEGGAVAGIDCGQDGPDMDEEGGTDMGMDTGTETGMDTGTETDTGGLDTGTETDTGGLDTTGG
ncbi:hypothetical protein PPSIR1_34183 [Plesiocystis pacifica SIR-1]|uniref:Lipoprotein n=1 Tax=Plesiocystis pacifica SIR-1 TaxID=391625 RepID=A6GF83_9BACT|nr:hypothetical protein [Plesiocystis pacifica]EDM75480.1 hypothetical protein PPSIR1_34183 [Plesiocystis pacifica SIR-1]